MAAKNSSKPKLAAVAQADDAIHDGLSNCIAEIYAAQGVLDGVQALNDHALEEADSNALAIQHCINAVNDKLAAVREQIEEIQVARHKEVANG